MAGSGRIRLQYCAPLVQIQRRMVQFFVSERQISRLSRSAFTRLLLDAEPKPLSPIAIAAQPFSNISAILQSRPNSRANLRQFRIAASSAPWRVG